MSIRIYPYFSTFMLYFPMIYFNEKKYHPHPPLFTTNKVKECYFLKEINRLKIDDFGGDEGQTRFGL